MREGRPEAAPRDAAERRTERNTTRRREPAFMKDTAFWIDWLDGHEHWWLRSLRWKREGRIG